MRYNNYDDDLKYIDEFIIKARYNINTIGNGKLLENNDTGISIEMKRLLGGSFILTLMNKCGYHDVWDLECYDNKERACKMLEEASVRISKKIDDDVFRGRL